MIKEAIEYLLELSTTSREPVILLSDGSQRKYLFDDQARKYQEVERFVQRQRAVSNIESFAAMVLEEARRATSDGDWMTAVFTTLGAQFHLNDRDGRTVFAYQRQLAPQWEILVGEAGKQMEHARFVRLLQRLRPSIVKYPEVLRDFRKISFGAGISIDSAPILEEGKGGLQYRFEVQATTRATQAALPSSIGLSIQYARGSQKRYEIEAEVSIDLAEKESKKSVGFTLILPDREALEEQAVSDEVAWFREATKTLPKLCILEDY